MMRTDGTTAPDASTAVDGRCAVRASPTATDGEAGVGFADAVTRWCHWTRLTTEIVVMMRPSASRRRRARVRAARALIRANTNTMPLVAHQCVSVCIDLRHVLRQRAEEQPYTPPGVGTVTLRRPFEVVDYQSLMALLPPPPEYFDTVFLSDPPTVAARQLSGVKARARVAASVPFFDQLWRAAGVDPDDITTLDDLWRFPTYTVDDIRRSIERRPPWGDYQGVDLADALHEPVHVYLSCGTTGKSRPTFYTQ